MNGKGRHNSSNSTGSSETDEERCSLFVIRVKPDSKAYRYDVEVRVRTQYQKEYSLTKGKSMVNRALCTRLLNLARNNTADFGLNGRAAFVYDGSAILFTSVQIPNSAQTKLHFSRAEVDQFVREHTAAECSYILELSPTTKGSHILDLTDYLAPDVVEEGNVENPAARYSERDNSHLTFFELATNQFAVNSGKYEPMGKGYLFRLRGEEKPIQNGIVLRHGVSKGVNIVKNYDNPVPAINLDAKVSPYFRPQSLVQTVKDCNNGNWPNNRNEFERIFNFLRDILVEVTFNRKRSFKIGKLTDDIVREYLIKEENGHKEYMPAFYQRVHTQNLRIVDAPAVMVGGYINPNQKFVEAYPIELLEVMDGQRVATEKLEQWISSSLTKENVVIPKERHMRILTHAQGLGLFNTKNEILSAFGISIDRESNNLKANHVNHPTIIYGKDKTVSPKECAEWDSKNEQYRLPAEVGLWIVLMVQGYEQLSRDFVKKFKERAQQKGIKFKTPAELKLPASVKELPIEVTMSDDDSWEKNFKICAARKIDIALFIDPKESPTHGLLKYYEAKYKVVTQHVTTRVAEDVVKFNKVMTRDNIVNKFNCKMGGLNYSPVAAESGREFDLSKGQTLVIGYDVCHKETHYKNGKCIDPSVVGICANMAKHPHIFCGDYFYQENRRENVDSNQLTDRVKWVLETATAQRVASGKYLPKYLFILRDGVSHGQYKMVIEQELPAIEAGCKAFDANYSPKIVVVICTKRHMNRFFETQQNGNGLAMVNLLPGSVMDEKFSTEGLQEYFMLSHNPIKGTAKVTAYQILVNQINLSKTQVQDFLHSLCFSHQIVNKAVSLPEPVYQADKLAERGFLNYETLTNVAPDEVPFNAEDNAMEYGRLNELLSFRGSKLGWTRTTA
ncbi:piwi domain-containing protein [Ditylenchus destructor]|uniref:Piwi domain-containing protein n=1 Tax=Ditylenchus destructor TaxID=166010 RepID=A0AAD4MS90_9BILA|nr:piwi domain-containing protein [Ditylenchus destructor]